MAASALPQANGRSPLALAKLLALAAPAALLGGAYYFQYVVGLPPCEMCYWQRWAHMAALAFAIVALLGGKMPDRGRSFVWLAALGILASGLIGAYHAGVELDYFEGLTQCTAHGSTASGAELLREILSAPLIRCDEVPWSLFGISMAGWNAILSLLAALTVLWLSLKLPPVRP
ncbi:MAG: disulfide bond formation protein B [Sphingosinicella sp.]|uniref:disulfide bond formation protein B n=1 Tax=Sphingosinicella sp. TaxID=1917971 RepID=UPI0040384689